MKIRTLAILAALATCLGLGGEARAQSVPASALTTAGEIHFAADFAAPPNQFMNAQGQMDGLNVDMCGEIARRMNLRIRWTNLAFPGLVPGLQANRFDALCTAIFINPQRLEIMNMVAYVQWGEGMMMRANDPQIVRCTPTSGDAASYSACFDQLSGRAVAVASAGTTHQNLRAQSERIRAAGRPEIVVRAFDTNADAIQAVVSGQAAAVYVNDPQGAFFINRDDANRAAYRMAFVGFNPNRLAIATLKPNRALADGIKTALEAMKADGTYGRIVAKWGVAAVPEFTIQP
jgi:polar amino acid transport system substrate-binding protein